jgi:hypothetical protein
LRRDNDVMTGADPYPTGGPASAAAEQDEIDAEERASSVDEREARLARDEAVADVRTELADERDHAADERERLADERERLADERERLADQREALADEREQRLNDLEARADARARNFGVPTETVPQRVQETIARGRALLAASSASLDRSQAALERQQVRTARHQQSVDRETATSQRALDAGFRPAQPADGGPEDRGERLRQRFLSAAAELVRVEEHIAEIYEHSGTSDPDRRARHEKIAQEAREAARHARLAAAQIDDGGTGPAAAGG